ncbi:hypothetical protein F5Y10DRAFT_94946 [Nemania abortiva]|nr:hypothetical protein F5Y10DRAFT_94946 [Nemania abortiva]
MSAAVQTMQSSALTAHAQSSATTAAVREHVCLFTHDLRRKQKRWQDGRLKYHTFNRRIMVYDERGNFVGDAHWREDYDLADGDEVELERGAVIVQVGECVGSRDQDLSELIDKRAQERAQRQTAAQAAAAARRPAIGPATPLHAVKPQHLPQKHLHDVIGTPSGHHGRAVLPKESPYEERRQKQAPQSDDTRPAKRQRRAISPPSKSGYAQNLFGAALTLSGMPLSQAPARHRPSKTSDTRQETTSLPPSSAGNDGDNSGPAIDTAQALISSPNGHSDLPRQTPPSANASEMSTKASSELHSLTRYPPQNNRNLSDDSEEALIHRKQQPKVIAVQRKEMVKRRSVLNSCSTNQNLGSSREVGVVTGKANTKIDRPGGVTISKSIQNKTRARVDNDCIQGDRSQVPVIDLIDDQADTPQGQPFHDEPRTELIIKPRKKRGLLMMSERHTIPNSSPKSKRTKAGPRAHNSPPSPNAQFADDSIGERDKKAKATETRANRADSSKNKLKPARRHKKTNGDSDDEANDDAGADDEFSKPRRRPSAGYASSSGTNEDCRRETLTGREDDAAAGKMPPPRLVKLGRRGINSKEVIGFIFDDELDPIVNDKRNSHIQEGSALQFEPGPGVDQQHYQAKNEICDALVANEARQDAESQSQSRDALAAKGLTVLRRQNSGQPKTPSNQESIAIQSEEAPSMITITATKQQPRSIANPATRGRKAAKPSDAAGQMPICPLPNESVGSLSLHQTPKKKNAQGNPDAGSANTMPGFSRANGGPWSREAHDLFDFKRPP